MNRRYTTDEIEKFWVGLLDADGSIQCNHCNKKYLQYRIVIQMKKQNLDMFLLFKKHFGGSVRVGNDYCIWVEDHQRRIWKLCEIFDRHPPLTSRVSCQLAWIKECNRHKDVDFMLQNRNKKYLNRREITRAIVARDIKTLPHFPFWLSGFIEGQASFYIRHASNHSFSIAQKHDLFLIQAICDFFGGSNKVRALKQDFYLWQVYKKNVLNDIVAHCEKFPLLGEKMLSLKAFKAKLLERKDIVSRSHFKGLPGDAKHSDKV